MGVSFQYWQRFIFDENFSLLPTVLTGGDGNGIQSMEFPLYNILFSPFFAFGIESGRILSLFASLFSVLLLTYWAKKLWTGVRLHSIDTKFIFPILFLCGVSSSYFYRFMPDYASFILVLIGAGYSLKNKKLNAFCLTSLGLLIKPPAIVTLGPLLLLKPFKEILLKESKWIIPSLIITIFYYTFGMQYLRDISDLPSYFYTEFRNPFLSIYEYLKEPKHIINFLLKDLFGTFLIIPILLYYLVKQLKSKRISISPLVYILLLQIIAIAALDGPHAFVHDYYFIGTSFIVGAIIVGFFNDAPKWLTSIFLFILFCNIVESGIYKNSQLFKNHSYQQCKALKKRNPDFPWNQHYAFRSDLGNTPYAGLCFGEKQGSKTSSYGLFRLKDEIPQDCKVVDKEQNFILTQCQK